MVKEPSRVECKNTLLIIVLIKWSLFISVSESFQYDIIFCIFNEITRKSHKINLITNLIVFITDKTTINHSFTKRKGKNKRSVQKKTFVFVHEN